MAGTHSQRESSLLLVASDIHETGGQYIRGESRSAGVKKLAADPVDAYG